MLRTSPHNEDWIPVAGRSKDDLVEIVKRYITDRNFEAKDIDVKFDWEKMVAKARYLLGDDTWTDEFHIAEVEVL